jgi:hypothetical protein
MSVGKMSRKFNAPLYAALALGLFVVGLGSLGLLSFAPSCDYAENEGIPRLQARFGFEGRRAVLTTASGEAAYYVIARVTPDGPLWRAGVRPGDRPSEYHGGGSCVLLEAMEASLAGNESKFGIVRGGAPFSGGGEWITLTLAPLSGPTKSQ